MRAALCLSLLLCVGCSKAHRPSKSVAAREVGCKKSGVQRSEAFEKTWTDDTGVLRMRYRVGVTCTKPKGSDYQPMDLWQECGWINDRWKCGDWQSGPVDGGPVDAAPSDVYLDTTKRGFVDE